MSEKKIRPELSALMTKRLAITATIEAAREYFDFLDKLNAIADDGDLSREHVREFSLGLLNESYSLNTDSDLEEEEDSDEA
jgi:hypothetical protein